MCFKIKYHTARVYIECIFALVLAALGIEFNLAIDFQGQYLGKKHRAAQVGVPKCSFYLLLLTQSIFAGFQRPLN